MRLDRALAVLIVVVLAATGALFFGKRRSGADVAVVEVSARPGSVPFLMVGIEGLDTTILERMRDDGRLPVLSGLISEGAFGEFASLGRGVDARVSWTSIVTGVAPERQGVGGKTMSPRGELVDAPLAPASRTVETLWTALSGSRPPVAVLGWPGTWPVEDLNGVMVAPYMDYVLERERGGSVVSVVSPPELVERVDPHVEERGSLSRKDLARFVDLETDLGLEALIGKGYEDLGLAASGDLSMVALAQRQTSEPGAWSLFVFLGGVDLVSQRFWHMANPEEIRWEDLTEQARELATGQCEALGATIERYYEFVDALLGELIELVAEDGTVVVVSDHGYEGLRYNDRGHPLIGSHLHDEKGLWVMRGPRVRRGSRAPEGDLLDVAPTVAAVLGVELRNATDGHVHADVLLD